MKPVDIYTRASPAGEGSSTHEDQERQARDFARGNGLPIGQVLRGESKSSSATLDRPVLQEARTGSEPESRVGWWRPDRSGDAKWIRAATRLGS